jgi:hypothetical protein
MMVSGGVTVPGIPAVLGRVILTVCAFGFLLLIMLRWWHTTVGERVAPLLQTLSTIETAPPDEPPASGSDEISKLADLVDRLCAEVNTSFEAARGSGQKAAANSHCGRLKGDLQLAADHVESIRALLEISQIHQQPIPRAVFQNLELVSKHLRETQQQLDAGPEAAHLEGALQIR